MKNKTRAAIIWTIEKKLSSGLEYKDLAPSERKVYDEVCEEMYDSLPDDLPGS